MAQTAPGPWLRVGKLIELFTAMGCTLSEVPGHLTDPGKQWKVRYLYSPEADDFQSLSDLDDNDLISPSELESWERRLGITIPKGPPS